MNFAFSEEQEELRRQARRWLTDKAPSAVVRRLMEDEQGYDPQLWAEMGRMGWLGMAIPEDYGGAGYGHLELSVLFEETGRSLLPAPFFSTVGLGGAAILEAGSDEQRKELLPRVATGELKVTMAVTEPNGRWDESGVEAVATPTREGWSLSGRKSFVLDGHTAELLVVAARSPGGVSLFLVDPSLPGISRRSLSTLDQTRKQAEVTLEGVEVASERLLGTEGAGWLTVQRVLTKAVVLLASEQVGGAQQCLDMAVGYAKTRHQFGRPIGSFQAIKHKCADMLVQVESARSAAYYAAWAASEDNEELPLVAPLVKSYCSEAFYFCAAENIQIHGGIGFTWEHDAHLYFKRAKSSELLFGDPVYHRAVLADRLGL
ncbi:MAG TPA: acyl-CoA dehydrogenase family protein [Acidimicrobiia bacterium]|jgi:alkylation response protein AidB-like acyl-CoA dehydrogenase